LRATVVSKQSNKEREMANRVGQSPDRMSPNLTMKVPMEQSDVWEEYVAHQQGYERPF
jgi:hypothetical protein